MSDYKELIADLTAAANRNSNSLNTRDTCRKAADAIEQLSREQKANPPETREMTPNERRIIRTCLCNGFEFHSRNGKTIVIGGEEFSRDRFEELVLAVDAALDAQTPAIDAVEVVRCEDCKYRTPNIIGEDYIDYW